MCMPYSIFSATQSSPYHLSAGAIVINDSGKIGTHHFVSHPEVLKRTGLQDMFLLVRETIEPGESLEQAALRGIYEEFGAKGEVLGYLGSRTTSFYHWRCDGTEDRFISCATLNFLELGRQSARRS